MKRSLFTIATALLAAAPLWAQEDVAASVAEATGKAAAPVTLLGLLQSGGWAMIPLALLSVLTVMLVLFFLLTLRSGAVVSNHFMNTADVLLKKRDYPALLAIANRHSEAIAQVVRRTLDFAEKNPSAPLEAVREIAQTEGGTQAAALQHRVTYLADIAVLAPMLGLLGTVFGIIHSFGVLASNVSQASRPILLAQGVSEALVATGAGLIVGIAAAAFYALFRNRVQALISDLERASTHVVSLLAVPYHEREIVSRQRGTGTGPRREPTRGAAVSVDDEF